MFYIIYMQLELLKDLSAKLNNFSIFICMTLILVHCLHLNIVTFLQRCAFRCVAMVECVLDTTSANAGLAMVADSAWTTSKRIKVCYFNPIPRRHRPTIFFFLNLCQIFLTSWKYTNIVNIYKNSILIILAYFLIFILVLIPRWLQLNKTLTAY